MNKQLLSVLGCSSSIAVALFGANVAEANTSEEYVFRSPDTSAELAEAPKSEVDYPFYDCSCSAYDDATIKRIDQEGDKAIAAFGCDCAGCRRSIASLDKTKKPRLSSLNKLDNKKQ